MLNKISTQSLVSYNPHTPLAYACFIKSIETFSILDFAPTKLYGGRRVGHHERHNPKGTIDASSHLCQDILKHYF